uniref:Uncharacterized protein n=1 Tax=Micrurus spixii TaxID=129469 RepID=A0A2D4MXA2_9SAUR
MGYVRPPHALFSPTMGSCSTLSAKTGQKMTPKQAQKTASSATGHRTWKQGRGATCRPAPNPFWLAGYCKRHPAPLRQSIDIYNIDLVLNEIQFNTLGLVDISISDDVYLCNEGGCGLRNQLCIIIRQLIFLRQNGTIKCFVVIEKKDGSIGYFFFF